MPPSTSALRRHWAPGLALGCALAVFLVQPAVTARYSAARVTSDSYALPPPEQVVLLSLGYRAAFADFIYAHLRVAHGIHFEERRRFDYVGDYLDVITHLDPKFQEPYLFADTFLTVQPVAPRQEDFYKARELMLLGTQQLPYNQEVWFTAGQYIAYLAAPHIADPTARDEWRVTGAKVLGRACELATSNPNIPHHCISAVTLLSRAGERDALIHMLRRTLAVNDDPEVRARALTALQEWEGEEQFAAQQRRDEAFQQAWQAHLHFVPKARLLLIGPRVDSFRCAGVSSFSDDDCLVSWRDWAVARGFTQAL